MQQAIDGLMEASKSLDEWWGESRPLVSRSLPTHLSLYPSEILTVPVNCYIEIEILPSSKFNFYQAPVFVVQRELLHTTIQYFELTASQLLI